MCVIAVQNLAELTSALVAEIKSSNVQLGHAMHDVRSANVWIATVAHIGQSNQRKIDTCQLLPRMRQTYAEYEYESGIVRRWVCFIAETEFVFNVVLCKSTERRGVLEVE